MNICLCGAESGYSHEPTCPYPLYRATAAQEDAWLRAEKKFSEFDRVWFRLSAVGACDGLGGAEWRRVWAEYLAAGMPADVSDFLRLRANILADGTEPRPV